MALAWFLKLNRIIILLRSSLSRELQQELAEFTAIFSRWAQDRSLHSIHFALEIWKKIKRSICLQELFMALVIMEIVWASQLLAGKSILMNAIIPTHW